MKSGICSITLREFTPEEVVRLASKAELKGIEWAGNVHVQPGDESLAESVREMTHEAGLSISSYGSYYKFIDESGKALDFKPVLDTALALKTDTIRIWAGHEPSDALTLEVRGLLIDKMRKDLDLAKEAGVKLALEFHANTLSDSNDATLRLLDELDHPALYTYWQPIYWLTDPAYRLDGLRRLASKVLNMHVFHWLFRPGKGTWGDSTDCRPLEEGTAEWKNYFTVPLDTEIEHYALLEFVRDNDPQQVLQDAATLKMWLGE